MPPGRGGVLSLNLLQVAHHHSPSFFFLAAASLTPFLSRLMVSTEPGAPGQPRVQDLRLEQPETSKPETLKPGSGWQAVVTWDPGETPEGRTFTLQYCRWVMVGSVFNKLASLEATLDRNYYQPTHRVVNLSS